MYLSEDLLACKSGQSFFPPFQLRIPQGCLGQYSRGQGGVVTGERGVMEVLLKMGVKSKLFPFFKKLFNS